VTKNQRLVVHHPEGDWAVKAPHAARVSSRHVTHAEAENRAKEIVRQLGRGEVTIQDRHGRFRDSDTVQPGSDPCPLKDEKH